MNLPPNVADLFNTAKATCARDGCKANPEWQLRIKVWAYGATKGPDNFLPMVLNLQVCSDHKDEIDPKNFWLPETRERISYALGAARKAPADFATAEIDWIPLGAEMNWKPD